MKKKEYIISSNEIQHLRELGFKHIGEGVYTYEFVGYKWRGFATITCRFTAFDDSKSILIDVLTESGGFYSPYYSDDKNSKVLAIVKSNITKEMKRCDIEVKNEI